MKTILKVCAFSDIVCIVLPVISMVNNIHHIKIFIILSLNGDSSTFNKQCVNLYIQCTFKWTAPGRPSGYRARLPCGRSRVRAPAASTKDHTNGNICLPAWHACVRVEVWWCSPIV